MHDTDSRYSERLQIGRPIARSEAHLLCGCYGQPNLWQLNCEPNGQDEQHVSFDRFRAKPPIQNRAMDCVQYKWDPIHEYCLYPGVLPIIPGDNLLASTTRNGGVNVYNLNTHPQIDHSKVLGVVSPNETY